MSDLFSSAGVDAPPSAAAENAPLAERLRPASLAEVVGQDHLLGPEGAIRRMADNHRLGSMILWGPPGTGKTTIARLLADAAGYQFQQLSAVFSGVADLRKAFEAAEKRQRWVSGPCCSSTRSTASTAPSRTASCPFVERGVVTLVGATTENPSFELNGALLSRCQVFVLRRLEAPALEQLLERAEAFVDSAACRWSRTPAPP